MTAAPRRLPCSLAVLAIALGLAPAVQAQRALAQGQGAIAMVSDLQGNVRLVRGSQAGPAELLADLGPGNRLEVGANGRVVVLVLASGEEATVRGPATAQIAAAGITATPESSLSRKSGAIGNTKLRRKDLAQAAIQMRKTDQTVRLPLLTLAGTYTLEERPVFRWGAVEGAGPYAFTLQDEAGRTLHAASVEATELALPADVRLEPGRLYTWDIAARRANGLEHANFGDFALASPALRAEAARLKPKDGAAFAEWVAYAVWLDAEELSDAARAIWIRLSKERPGEALLERMAQP